MPSLPPRAPLSFCIELSLITYSYSLLRLVPKGGWEPSDVQLEAAASREALEEGPTRSSLRVIIS
jgi:hypothetical protein